MPRMLSGHHQGRFLAFISKLLRPQYILEIGTYTGYGTLCLAEGLRDDGVIHTIDYNEELADIQLRYFRRSAYADRIIRHTGDAREIIPGLTEKFDLIFLDADKLNYPHYYDLLKSKVHPGSLLIADNVLWSGKVLDEKFQDKDTAGLREFNRRVHRDPEVEHILLPLRDGLMMLRYLS